MQFELWSTNVAVAAFYEVRLRKSRLDLTSYTNYGSGSNMPESRSLERKADCELATPDLKRAKMTPSQEPKLGSCLKKKTRRRGSSKKLTKKKVRFEMPVQATVAYCFFLRKSTNSSEECSPSWKKS
ncbi:hypothetical protein PoB_002832500 [Plakobranchus ocellatus]|uniref:Uncharacterized protein n=1 Tax=Plakobranchus ocellatus TaxID=259542 RepID=A0AAV4A392_9GAST|nr:hypothetical protein PoB_002832500 [Plakobranchus ocellatus]